MSPLRESYGVSNENNLITSEFQNASGQDWLEALVYFDKVATASEDQELSNQDEEKYTRYANLGKEFTTFDEEKHPKVI